MRSNSSHKIVLIILSGISLLTGGFIYLLFRNTNLLMFSWVSKFGANNWLMTVRETVLSLKLPDFVIYCLPDGLWTTSFILIMDAIWSTLKEKLFWASIIPVIGIASEILQIVHILPGTFDYGDLLCYTLPLITNIIVVLKINSYESH